MTLSYQTKLVLIALIVAESAWIFSALGLLGLWVGHNSSPMAWPTILLLMAASLYVATLRPSETIGSGTEILARMVIIILIIYLAIAIEFTEDLPWIDLLWVLKIFSPTIPDQFWFTFIAGSVVGAILCMRTGRLATSSYPADDLATTFRIGIPLLVLSSIVDLISEHDLHTFLMIFIFFGSVLSGLTIGHLLPSSGDKSNSIWIKVIIGIVPLIVTTGLAFSFLPPDILSLVAWPMKRLIEGLLAIVAWVLVMPAAFIISSVVEGLIWLYSLLLSGDPQTLQSPPASDMSTSTPSNFEEITDLEGTGANIWIMQVLLALVLVVTAVSLIYAGARAFRRPRIRRAVPMAGNRVSIAEDSDQLLDLANLLWKSRPSWLRRDPHPSNPIINAPPGIIEIMEIYYDLMVLAEEQGVRRQPQETVWEFETRLYNVFPEDIVRSISTAFTWAFYGNYHASKEKISGLRSSVDGLAIETA